MFGKVKSFFKSNDDLNKMPTGRLPGGAVKTDKVIAFLTSKSGVSRSSYSNWNWKGTRISSSEYEERTRQSTIQDDDDFVKKMQDKDKKTRFQSEKENCIRSQVTDIDPIENRLLPNVGLRPQKFVKAKEFVSELQNFQLNKKEAESLQVPQKPHRKSLCTERIGQISVEAIHTQPLKISHNELLSSNPEKVIIPKPKPRYSLRYKKEYEIHDNPEPVIKPTAKPRTLKRTTAKISRECEEEEDVLLSLSDAGSFVLIPPVPKPRSDLVKTNDDFVNKETQAVEE